MDLMNVEIFVLHSRGSSLCEKIDSNTVEDWSVWIKSVSVRDTDGNV
jgi:hypothetical protein